ncbi:MAG: hypothetical protein LBS69_00745 [Prevotellaceae bacterium]|jgi:hypothetical protein|nr:hypothetical protein [Prevotellaceae bacterium]
MKKIILKTTAILLILAGADFSSAGTGISPQCVGVGQLLLIINKYMN